MPGTLDADDPCLRYGWTRYGLAKYGWTKPSFASRSWGGPVWAVSTRASVRVKNRKGSGPGGYPSLLACCIIPGSTHDAARPLRTPTPLLSLSMTDAAFDEWCRRIVESDRDAYEEVFRAMYAPLVRYAASITRREASARDLVQDVFVSLWESRRTLDPTQSLEAYLYRAVRNRAYNEYRNRRTRSDKERDIRDEPVGLLSEPPDPDDAVDAQTLQKNLEVWIAELPDRQREALTLSRFQGLSHDDIAEAMDISPRTVNNHIVRALRSLRERVRTYEPSLLDA